MLPFVVLEVGNNHDYSWLVSWWLLAYRAGSQALFSCSHRSPTEDLIGVLGEVQALMLCRLRMLFWPLPMFWHVYLEYIMNRYTIECLLCSFIYILLLNIGARYRGDIASFYR